MFCKACVTGWFIRGSNDCPSCRQPLFSTRQQNIFWESDELTLHKYHLNVYDPMHISRCEMIRLGVKPQIAEFMSSVRKRVLEEGEVTLRYRSYRKRHVAVQRRLDLLLSKF